MPTFLSPLVFSMSRRLCPCLQWASLAQLAGLQGASVAITCLESGSCLRTGMSWTLDGKKQGGDSLWKKKKKASEGLLIPEHVPFL